MMNTSMKEMNLNEMEAVCGGFDFKRFLSAFDTEDALIAILGGPFGQGLILGKAGAILAAELNAED